MTRLVRPSVAEKESRSLSARLCREERTSSDGATPQGLRERAGWAG